MAAALLDHHAMGRVRVRSAGSMPGSEVNPAAVDALAEWGIDISQNTPKVLEPEAVADSDVVITMGCGDACPIFPGKQYLDWELADPAGEDLDTVRMIRDDIDQRIRVLLSDLLDKDAT
jgi:protein-tyrosine-phosphatase